MESRHNLRGGGKSEFSDGTAGMAAQQSRGVNCSWPKTSVVIICEVCLRIAGYNNSDIVDGAIIGKPEIISNLLTNATVVDY